MAAHQHTHTHTHSHISDGAAPPPPLALIGRATARAGVCVSVFALLISPRGSSQPKREKFSSTANAVTPRRDFKRDGSVCFRSLTLPSLLFFSPSWANEHRSLTRRSSNTLLLFFESLFPSCDGGPQRQRGADRDGRKRGANGWMEQEIGGGGGGAGRGMNEEKAERGRL